MAKAMRGDIAAVAQQSFDCIMCGLCAARCPAEEVQYNIAILCRRLYGKYLSPKAQHLSERLEEIKAGKFDQPMREIKSLSQEELRQRYNKRDIEPA
jgi:ferredoxin